VKKAKEVHKELAGLQVSLGDYRGLYDYIFWQEQEVPVTIRQFMEQKDKNLALDQQIKEKSLKIKAFQGLPPVWFVHCCRGPQL
jgi:hypothetical protein